MYVSLKFQIKLLIIFSIVGHLHSYTIGHATLHNKYIAEKVAFGLHIDNKYMALTVRSQFETFAFIVD